MGTLPVDYILQILHGVRIQIDKEDFYFILRTVHSLKLHNVIQYCDQQMIQYLYKSPRKLQRFEFLEADSLNGVFRCENFAQYLEQNEFPTVPIGSAGGLNGWFITLQMLNEQLLFPAIHCDDKPTLQLRSFFSVIKKDGSSCFEMWGCLLIASDYSPVGHDMSIMDILNEENGYLDDDGALTVEYGIHVEAILGDDKIWGFNFHDKFFSSSSQNQMVKLRDALNNVWYIHKQFSSDFCLKKFETRSYIGLDKRLLNNLLQVIHGIPIPLMIDEFYLSLSIAHALKSRKLIHYCGQKMLEYLCSTREKLETSKFVVQIVFFGLRRSLVHMVKRYGKLKDLVKVIKKFDLEKMPGESMKTFAAKIFTRKF